LKWEEPIRAEIFGIERLEQHAESLAAAQRTTEEFSKGRNLRPRVRDNAQVLLAAYRSTAETVREKSEITPAAEWLLDNFHIVEEQIRGIRDHLPGSYYRLLPKIAAGHLAGYPCVYGLVWAYVAHTDSRFELETLQRFVRAYQRARPLTIGELWAVAIHLRVALVENLRRLSQLIVRSRQARAMADKLADRLLGLSGGPAEDTRDVLEPLGDAPLRRPFAVQLVQRLRDQGTSCPGRGNGHRAQHHHQHALDVLHRLGRIFRGRQSGGRSPPRRSRVRGLRLCDAGRVPSPDRATLEGIGAFGDRGGAG
jgi:cyclic beta-1,2-glucan synthetase